VGSLKFKKTLLDQQDHLLKSTEETNRHIEEIKKENESVRKTNERLLMTCSILNDAGRVLLQKVNDDIHIKQNGFEKKTNITMIDLLSA